MLPEVPQGIYQSQRLEGIFYVIVEVGVVEQKLLVLFILQMKPLQPREPGNP